MIWSMEASLSHALEDPDVTIDDREKKMDSLLYHVFEPEKIATDQLFICQ
jgi:hypothetical protein